MAYDTEKLFEQAIEIATKNKLIFIADLTSYLPCHRDTFYEHFPPGSDKHKSIVDLLERNKIIIKSSMRNKWYKSNAPALQLALYKLLSTDEELKKLSMQHVEQSGGLEHKLHHINYDDLPDEILEEILRVGTQEDNNKGEGS